MNKVPGLLLGVLFIFSTSCAGLPEWISEGDSNLNGVTLNASGLASEKFRGKANEILMAEEAARADARSKLTEAIVGSYVRAIGNVENREAVESAIRSEVEGFVRGMVIQKKFYDEGKRIYYVLAHIDKSDIDAILNKLNQKMNTNVNYETLNLSK
jgi:hypothetical protein